MREKEGKTKYRHKRKEKAHTNPHLFGQLQTLVVVGCTLRISLEGLLAREHRKAAKSGLVLLGLVGHFKTTVSEVIVLVGEIDR